MRCALCESRNTQGFTLVELIVSVTITALLMIGVSAFFAGSFHNIILTQEKLDESQGDFSANEIIRGKLANVDKIQSPSPFSGTPSSIVIKNKITDVELPFTFIGKVGGKIVFKDFFVFNGKIGNRESAESDILNPAGITKVGSDYYIAAPLENKIYKCNSSIDSCSPISTEEEFAHPTDITTDGTDLFVSDSGNDRIIKMDIDGDTIIESMGDGLNFPTGLAYNNNRLFVSDTYNNRVVWLSTNLGSGYPLDTSLLTVAGEGESDACDNTAKFCKLNFPTGLAIDSAKRQLYIADTGSGRILVVTDPPSIDEYTAYDFLIPNEMPMQKISKIDIKFPQNISASEDLLISNDLHTAKFDSVGSVLSMYFSVPIINGDATKQVCANEIDPCDLYFERFTVSEDNNIFESGDPILIGPDKDPFNVTGVPQPSGVYVDPNTDYSFSPGDIVIIDEVFGGGFTFVFDLSTSGITSGFNPISVDIYDENDVLTYSQNKVLRVGNGVIGTSEDTIEDLGISLPYPTGLGWSSNLEYTTDAEFDTGFSEYDYQSGYDVTDLEFSETNSGNILQMDFETDSENSYVINASLN